MAAFCWYHLPKIPYNSLIFFPVFSQFFSPWYSSDSFLGGGCCRGSTYSTLLLFSKRNQENSSHWDGVFSFLNWSFSFLSLCSLCPKVDIDEAVAIFFPFFFFHPTLFFIARKNRSRGEKKLSFSLLLNPYHLTAFFSLFCLHTHRQTHTHLPLEKKGEKKRWNLFLLFFLVWIVLYFFGFQRRTVHFCLSFAHHPPKLFWSSLLTIFKL